ncbi:MAG: hypothetical protein J5817_10665 [Treponema sp.]|nr:hypothetical protein [Treponema sp.]
MASKKSGRIFKVLSLVIAVSLAGSSLSAGGTKDQGKTSSKSTVASSVSQSAQSSYFGTKSPSAQKAVGDIVFKDGSATPYKKGLKLTKAQGQAAVAVIFYVGSDCSNDGRQRTLGVGLVHDKSGIAWCSENASAYNLEIKSIECPSQGKSGGYTFSGDRDGSDNLLQIAGYLKENGKKDDTSDPSKYPAFYWAKNYSQAKGSNVSGTEYADGWYLPSSAELFKLFKAKDTLDDVSWALFSTGISGGEFGYEKYMSASQEATSASSDFEKVCATMLGFATGALNITGKKPASERKICAIREFGAAKESQSALAKAGSSSSSSASSSSASSSSSSSNNSSYTGTIIGTKSPSEERKVGDIVFTDGSSIPYSKGMSLTPSQKNAAVAVVCYVGKDCSDDGKRRVIGVGLCQSKGKVQLCTSEATLAYRYVPSLSDDKLRSGSSAFAKISETFRNNGDWDDTDDESKYPAFAMANKYASLSGSHAAGSGYATGWYLPTKTEDSRIRSYSVLSTVNAALEACGAAKIEGGTWWTVSNINSDQGLLKTKATDSYQAYFLHEFAEGRPAKAEEAKSSQAKYTPSKGRYIGSKAPTEKRKVGDIVFNDGSAEPYAKNLLLSDAQKKSAVAVIFYVGKECSDDGKERALGIASCGEWANVGKNNRKTMPWFYTQGNDTNVAFWQNVTSLQPAKTKDGSQSVQKLYDFIKENTITSETGIIQIGGKRVVENQDWFEFFKTVFPVFESAEYFAQYRKLPVSGTEYETNWYAPTITELKKAYEARATVEAALSLCGGTRLQGKYWSVSQCEKKDWCAYAYDFSWNSGLAEENKSWTNAKVIAIREFSAKAPGKTADKKLLKISSLSNVSGSDAKILPIPSVKSRVTKLFSSKSYIGTKAPSAPKAVGDIVFKDGSAKPYKKGTKLTAEEAGSAIAVIFYKGKDCSYNGKERTLGVGLKNAKTVGTLITRDAKGPKILKSASNICWCTEDASAAHVDLVPLKYAHHKDGSYALEQIASWLKKYGKKDDTSDPAKYPLFYWAKNYAGVEGSNAGSTPFADGWYVPSSNEMQKLKEALQAVDEARTSCGGDSLMQEIFFTSSTQRAEEWDYVVISGRDGIYAPPKWTGGGNSQTVCAIREFD